MQDKIGKVIQDIERCGTKFVRTTVCGHKWNPKEHGGPSG